jgi:hypothetical protein
MSEEEKTIIEAGEMICSGSYGNADNGSSNIKIFYNKCEDGPDQYNYILEYTSEQYNQTHVGTGFDNIAAAAYDAGYINAECDAKRKILEKSASMDRIYDRLFGTLDDDIDDISKVSESDDRADALINAIAFRAKLMARTNDFPVDGFKQLISDAVNDIRIINKLSVNDIESYDSNKIGDEFVNRRFADIKRVARDNTRALLHYKVLELVKGDSDGQHREES